MSEYCHNCKALADEAAALRQALQAILDITTGRQPKDYPAVRMIAKFALAPKP